MKGAKNQDEHERARMLIALAGPEGNPAEEQNWLHAHLDSCASCREFAETSRAAVSALRSISITAGGSLVTATQLRVRRRAMELQRHRERMWVISVCCLAVTLATALTTVIMWRGLEWMGQQARLSAPLWEIGFIVLGVMPAVVAGILLLARGTYMADHNGTFSG